MTLKRIILLMSLSTIFLLTACDQTVVIDTTAIAAQVITVIAQTVEAMPSATPEPTATETPTPTATETQTSTPSPSASPTSSFTPANNIGVPGAPAQATGCDSVVFVSDVTVPDGTAFSPGVAFTKTWKLKNSGTCTWTGDYAIVFVNGNKMSGGSPQKLTGKTVTPGQSVDISVNLVSPTQLGEYTGYWQMQNASGFAFGQAFYVQIKVAVGTPATPTATATGATATPTNTTVPATATLTATPEPTATDTETATATP